MVFQHLKYHKCNLRLKTATYGLPPLSPSANWIEKFTRRLRKIALLDENSVKSMSYFRNKSTMLMEQKRHARSKNVFVIHPFSKLATFIEICFVAVYLIKYFSLPFLMGQNLWLNRTWFFIEILDIVYAFIVFSFFFLGYITSRKEIVIDHKKIVIHYITRYFFFDLICISYDFFWIPLILHETLNPLIWYSTIIVMIAYFARYFYFMHSIKNVINMCKFPDCTYFIVFHAFNISNAIHMFSCAIYYIAETMNHGDPESWVTQSKYEHSASPTSVPINKLEQFYLIFVDSIIMIFCHFFPISHRHYTITLPSEQLILTITVLFGRMYTIFLIADLLKIFGLVLNSENKYEKYLRQLEEYMSSNNLPHQLRMRLLKYYEYKLQRHYFNENQILATLSEHLRNEVFMFGARKLIEKAFVFKSVPKATLGTLLSHMKSETFLATDIIIRIGSKVQNIYFICSGTVAVFDHQGKELLHLEDGDEFGVISLFAPQAIHIYKVVAAETTEVYYMPKKIFLEVFHAHPEVVKHFEYRIKQRLIHCSYISNSPTGGDDLISNINSGQLFERPYRRTNGLSVL